MIAIVSGGFDPLHIGHIRLMDAATKLGPVWVILNSDKWLMRKKGFVFMPLEHRKIILDRMGCCVRVLPVDDDDDTVCEALRFIRDLKPDNALIFCNGGDRSSHAAESATCVALGITQAVSVGGEKIESSTALVKRISRK